MVSLCWCSCLHTSDQNETTKRFDVKMQHYVAMEHLRRAHTYSRILSVKSSGDKQSKIQNGS